MQSPYAGYVYAYPHKTTYRTLEPAIALQDAWRGEDMSALFLYLHVPFCEMRCGFCNLFTVANPKAELQKPFLQAVERQILAVAGALNEASFSRFAIGGGTPTFLSVPELERIFSLLKSHLEIDPRAIPTGVEVSPGTVDTEKLTLLHEVGVERVSMGVQSFHPEIVKAMGRPEKEGEVERALDLIKATRFPRFNLDLIYGAAGQTEEKWQKSLEIAVSHAPEEIFLYPLYVRPLTGLDKIGKSWDDQRLALYRQGRDYLRSQGYAQVSMRMFQKPGLDAEGRPAYCCQEDGMLGLGPGARSYTRTLHYSSEYAVGRPGVKQIIGGYQSMSVEDFGWIRYGARLSGAEEKRRYLLKSLLNRDGLSEAHYRTWFGTEAWEDFAELSAMADAGLVTRLAAADGRSSLNLTDEGMMLSDAIGPWLYSASVREKMEAWAWS